MGTGDTDGTPRVRPICLQPREGVELAATHITRQLSLRSASLTTGWLRAREPHQVMAGLVMVRSSSICVSGDFQRFGLPFLNGVTKGTIEPQDIDAPRARSALKLGNQAFQRLLSFVCSLFFLQDERGDSTHLALTCCQRSTLTRLVDDDMLDRRILDKTNRVLQPRCYLKPHHDTTAHIRR